MINDREKLPQALYMACDGFVVRFENGAESVRFSQSRRVAEYHHIVIQSEYDLVNVPLHSRNFVKGLGNIK
jgi:hypothetical protein